MYIEAAGDTYFETRSVNASGEEGHTEFSFVNLEGDGMRGWIDFHEGYMNSTFRAYMSPALTRVVKDDFIEGVHRWAVLANNTEGDYVAALGVFKGSWMGVSLQVEALGNMSSFTGEGSSGHALGWYNVAVNAKGDYAYNYWGIREGTAYFNISGMATYDQDSLNIDLNASGQSVVQRIIAKYHGGGIIGADLRIHEGGLSAFDTLRVDETGASAESRLTASGDWIDSRTYAEGRELEGKAAYTAVIMGNGSLSEEMSVELMDGGAYAYRHFEGEGEYYEGWVSAWLWSEPTTLVYAYTRLNGGYVMGTGNSSAVGTGIAVEDSVGGYGASLLKKACAVTFSDGAWSEPLYEAYLQAGVTNGSLASESYIEAWDRSDFWVYDSIYLEGDHVHLYGEARSQEYGMAKIELTAGNGTSHLDLHAESHLSEDLYFASLTGYLEAYGDYVDLWTFSEDYRTGFSEARGYVEHGSLSTDIYTEVLWDLHGGSMGGQLNTAYAELVGFYGEGGYVYKLARAHVGDIPYGPDLTMDVSVSTEVRRGSIYSDWTYSEVAWNWDTDTYHAEAKDPEREASSFLSQGFGTILRASAKVSGLSDSGFSLIGGFRFVHPPLIMVRVFDESSAVLANLTIEGMQIHWYGWGHVYDVNKYVYFDLHPEDLKGSLIPIDAEGRINAVEDEVDHWLLVLADIPDHVEDYVSLPERYVGSLINVEMGELSALYGSFTDWRGASTYMDLYLKGIDGMLLGLSYVEGAGVSVIYAHAGYGSLRDRVNLEARSTIGPYLYYEYPEHYVGDFGTCWIDGKPISELEIDHYLGEVIVHNAAIAKQEVWLSGVGLLALSSTDRTILGGYMPYGDLYAHMHSHTYPYNEEHYTYSSFVFTGPTGHSEVWIAIDSMSLILRKYIYFERINTARPVTFPYYRGPFNDPYGLLDETFRIDQVPWGVGMVYGYDPIVGSVEDVGDVPATPLNETSGGAFVDVAVIDTGVDGRHLDLVRRLEDFASFWGPYALPWNSLDLNGHGTHVCGTIVADAGYDQRGIYGVAPEANLYVYDVFSLGGYVHEAMIRAVDLGAEIISMSLCFGIPDRYGNFISSDVIIDMASLYPELHAALLYAYYNDVLTIAATGNERDALELNPALVTYGLPSICYPAASRWVVAVGAIAPNKEPAFFTSSGLPVWDAGYDAVELAAPGMGLQPEGIWNRLPTYRDRAYILSHYPTWIFSTYTTLWWLPEENRYAWMIGTSMATPHVSGLAAKLWQGGAESTRGFLRSIAEDIWSPGYDEATGFGLPRVPSWWRDVPWWWRCIGV